MIKSMPQLSYEHLRDLADDLYGQLEYYRNFMPYCVGMTEIEYANTQEAKGADRILSNYRKATGIEAEPKPTPPRSI